MLCRKCQRVLDDQWISCPYCHTIITPQRRARRRGNGMGTAYKRGRTWTACVTVESYARDGKVIQRRKTKGGFPTETKALQYCAILASQTETRRSPTLSYYWEVFSRGKMAKLSASKQTAYEIAYEKLGDLRGKAIGKLSVADLQAIINATCPTYYPARDMRVLLNHLYKLAAADGHANPGLPPLLELPKLEEAEAEPFTHQEQELLWMAYERGQADCAMPLIMIYTGIMPGELRQMTTAMIDWEHKQIVGAGLKTPTRRKQSVLLPDAILPVLEDAAKRCGEGLLFPMDKTTFYERYYAALDGAGITRHLSPYACRHTAATALAIDKNVAPQTLQRLMRWGSTRMADRYVHPDDTTARAALNLGSHLTS